MNVTRVLAQIELPVLAVMFTEGVIEISTVNVIGFDVEVVGLAQVSEDVNTQVTISPVAKLVF